MTIFPSRKNIIPLNSLHHVKITTVSSLKYNCNIKVTKKSGERCYTIESKLISGVFFGKI